MKLDRALMADLYTDPWAQGVTAAVLAMARAMQIRSVADGIDDAATLDDAARARLRRGAGPARRAAA